MWNNDFQSAFVHLTAPPMVLFYLIMFSMVVVVPLWSSCS